MKGLTDDFYQGNIERTVLPGSKKVIIVPQAEAVAGQSDYKATTRPFPSVQEEIIMAILMSPKTL